MSRAERFETVGVIAVLGASTATSFHAPWWACVLGGIAGGFLGFLISRPRPMEGRKNES
jgi:hypothetical protein